MREGLGLWDSQKCAGCPCDAHNQSLKELIPMALNSDSSEFKAFGGISRRRNGRCGYQRNFYKLKIKAVGITIPQFSKNQ
jgi:hypothetical protein